MRSSPPISPDEGVKIRSGRDLHRVEAIEVDFYSSSKIKRFLCFSGFFRLSGTNRVVAGTMPDFRASRRASVPLSNFFFRSRVIVSAFLDDDFLNRSVALVDRLICVRKDPGV